MKKTLKRMLILTLAMVLLTGTFAVTADAAMKRTVKYQYFTLKTPDADKSAAKVKKGTTTLTITRSEGYVKFTAPATKTYNFTFSDYKIKGKSLCFISAYKKSPIYAPELDVIKVSTKGGKTDMLRLSSTKNKEFNAVESKKTVDKYLHKRSAKIKLKKGESVYFYIYGAKAKKSTMKLKIK